MRYTLATINTGSAQGKMYASIYVRLVTAGPPAAAWTRCPPCCANACKRVPGITVTQWACWMRWAAKQIEFSLQGQTFANWNA